MSNEEANIETVSQLLRHLTSTKWRKRYRVSLPNNFWEDKDVTGTLADQAVGLVNCGVTADNIGKAVREEEGYNPIDEAVETIFQELTDVFTDRAIQAGIDVSRLKGASRPKGVSPQVDNLVNRKDMSSSINSPLERERRPMLPPPLKLTFSERARASANATAKYSAWLMEQDDQVKDFRRRFSGGRLLSENECWERLTNPLLQVLEFSDFEELGILPANTAGYIEAPLGEDGCRPLEDDHVRLDEYASIIEQRYDDQQERHVEVMTYLTVIEQSHGFGYKRYTKKYLGEGWCRRFQVVPADRLSTWSTATCPSGDVSVLGSAKMTFWKDWKDHQEVRWAGSSVVKDAVMTAEELATGHLIDLWDALRFLITGIPPQCDPVRAVPLVRNPRSFRRETLTSDVDGEVIRQRRRRWFRYNFWLPLSDSYLAELFSSAGPINLTVQPWMTPEELAEVWRSIRPKGNRYPPMIENLKDFCFVLDEMRGSKKAQWTMLAKKLNESTHPMTKDKLLHNCISVREALFPGYQKKAGSKDANL